MKRYETKVINSWLTKATFSLILVLFVSSLTYAQNKWKRLTQKPLQVSYRIPAGWFIGGYMKDRDSNCLGATINSDPDRGLNMVIFESKPEDLEELKERDLWGYHFVPTTEQESVETPQFEYLREQSVWKEDDSLTVYRFITQTPDRAYIVYFWGDHDYVKENYVIIDSILKSIEPAQ